MSDSNPTISVVVPCFNNERTIGAALEAVLNQSVKSDEVIVINDGSTDSSQKIIEKYSVKHVELPKNRGLAYARNLGYKTAKGEIIVFFDADTIPDPDCLEIIIRCYHEFNNAVGVGGQAEESSRESCFDLWRSIFWRQWHGPQAVLNPWMLMGLCSSYKKKVLDKVDGFDETFRANGEDVDIGIRIRKSGEELYYSPNIKVKHLRKDTFSSFFKMVFRHSYWQIYACLKNKYPSSKLFINKIKWLFISTGSSIKTHKNIKLTILSPFANIVSICAALWAYFIFFIKRIFGAVKRVLKDRVQKRSNLLFNLVLNELRSRYTGSVIGFLWAFINPLILLVIYTFVFSGILKIKFGGIQGYGNFAVYLFCGFLPWLFFSDSVLQSIDVLIRKRNLVKKVFFPRELLPVYIVVTNFIIEIIGLIVFIGVLMSMEYSIGVSILFLIPLFIFQFLFTIGFGFTVCSLNLYYRDIGHLTNIFLTAWFFVTPIFYPVSLIPEKLMPLMRFNPLLHLVEAYRNIILDNSLPTVGGMTYFGLCSIIAFSVGYFIFMKTKRDFADLL